LRNKIIYIIMIVVLLGFAFTFTSAVAYWSTELDTTNVQIEVSDEVAHLEVLDMNSEVTGWLVPEGFDHFAGEVTEVIFRYQVSLDKELIRTINLIVESMEVTIGGETTYAHLVDIDIGGEKDLKIYDLYNDSVTVVIKVRLIEPIDALEAASKGIDTSKINVEDSVSAYESIKGQKIEITLGFRIETRQDN